MENENIYRKHFEREDIVRINQNVNQVRVLVVPKYQILGLFKKR